MSAYVPEFTYGFTGWDERNQPTYGLLPWPRHIQPRKPEQDIRSAKKGESHVEAALAEAGGVFFLTLDRNDRLSIATTIERLLALLDEMDGDPDLEDFSDAEPEETDQNGDEGDYGMCEDDATEAQLYGVYPVSLPGGQGL